MPKLPTDTEKRFKDNFSNPDKLDSSSQFNPKLQGKLYPEFKQFLAEELHRQNQEWIAFVEEEIIGGDEEARTAIEARIFTVRNGIRAEQRAALKKRVKEEQHATDK